MPNIWTDIAQIQAIKSYHEPEPGSVDWLWYCPSPGLQASLQPHYHSVCEPCDVFGMTMDGNNRYRCWNCGKFTPRPLSRGW